MAERIVWGVDIGQTAVRAVKVQSSDGSQAVVCDTFFLSLDSHPDDPDYLEKVESALTEFSIINVEQVPVVLSVRGASSLFRLFAVPPVSDAKLPEIISYEARQLIPYPLEEVLWDYQVVDVNQETGDLQIALLCCRRDIVEDMLKITDRLKIEVADIQVAPLALVNFCRFDFYESGRMLLLDAGSRGTDFVIFDENLFWLRSIPNSGNDFVKALMEKYRMEEPSAASLMGGAANPKQNAQIFETVTPLFQSLAGEVQRSIGFYRSTKRDAHIDEMLLAGNTFKIPGVDQLMADMLGYATRSLDLPHRIGLSPAINEEALYQQRQVYGTAVGLGLQGLGLAEYKCSLLPQNRKIARLVRAKEIYGWLIAAVVVLMVAIEMVSSINRRPLYENHLREIDSILGTAHERKDNYLAMLEQFKPAQQVNLQLIDIGKGRGAIFSGEQQFRKAIRDFNTVQQKPLFKESLVGVTMREYERRARECINAYKPSADEYKRLIEEKTNNPRRSGGFKEDFAAISALKSADIIAEEMQTNLELQVLRYVMLKHQRRGRVFIKKENYQLAYAEKQEGEGGVVTWKIVDPNASRPVITAPPAAKTTGRKINAVRQNETEDSADELEETVVRPVVIVEAHGFIVDSGIVGGATNADTATRLKDYFIGLEKSGFYLFGNAQIEDGFTLVRSESRNTINLPVIYSPMPKEVRDEDLGERKEISRAEVLSWQAAEETVHSFRVRLLYEPQSMAIDNKTIRAMLADSMQYVRDAVAPVRGVIASDATTGAKSSDDKKATDGQSGQAIGADDEKKIDEILDGNSSSISEEDAANLLGGENTKKK